MQDVCLPLKSLLFINYSCVHNIVKFLLIFHFSSPTGDKYAHQWEALAGWFLGPRAENRHIFNELTLKALNWHEDRREEFFPSDPSYFTDEFKNSEAARHEYKDMEDQMHAMHQELNKSIPFFSTRYQVSVACTFLN